MAKAKYTVKKIVDLKYDDILKMNEKELREALNVGVSASNKRLRRLQEKNLSSAYVERAIARNQLDKRKKRQFTSRHKTQAQLRRELNEVKNFLSAKSTTIRGARALNKQVAERIGKSYEDFSLSAQQQFWNLYNRVAKEYPHLAYQDSDQIQRLVLQKFNSNKTKTLDQLHDEITKELDKRYESIVEEDEFEKAFGFSLD